MGLRCAAVPRPSLYQLLQQQSAELDRLMAEVSGGLRNQAHYDEIEERAQSIGRAVPEAFRKGTR